MDDYSSRRQEEGEWQLVVKGRNKSLKQNSKRSNTNVVHGNNQRVIKRYGTDVRHEKYHEKNMSSSSSSEEKIPPMDIQIEIMKRLPIKSLLKFMSVSKQWKSIIQSSRFIADYNGRRHILPPHHFFVGYCNKYYVDIFNDDTSFLQRLVLPMSAAVRPDYMNRLIGYSQGLFGFHFHDVVIIWNPSIRKSVFIPVPEHRRHGNYGFTVVCNATEPTSFGITYEHRLRQVDIYTLTTGVWRTFSNTLDRESINFTWKRVAINMFIHWIAFDCTPEGHRLNNLIVSCDIISEQFTELCLPPSLAAASTYFLNVYELRESLVVVEEDVHQQEIGVWMMMMMELGVQNSFRKLYTVKLPYTSNNFLSAKVLGFRKDGQPILQMDVFPYKRKLLTYEPDLERFNDIHISGNTDSWLADSYTETLLLLDH